MKIPKTDDEKNKRFFAQKDAETRIYAWLNEKNRWHGGLFDCREIGLGIARVSWRGHAWTTWWYHEIEPLPPDIRNRGD